MTEYYALNNLDIGTKGSINQDKPNKCFLALLSLAHRDQTLIHIARNLQFKNNN